MSSISHIEPCYSYYKAEPFHRFRGSPKVPFLLEGRDAPPVTCPVQLPTSPSCGVPHIHWWGSNTHNLSKMITVGALPLDCLFCLAANWWTSCQVTARAAEFCLRNVCIKNSDARPAGPTDSPPCVRRIDGKRLNMKCVRRLYRDMIHMHLHKPT